MNVCMYVCMYVCVYVCMYVGMCVLRTLDYTCVDSSVSVKFEVVNQLAEFYDSSYEYCPIVAKPELVLINFMR